MMHLADAPFLFAVSPITREDMHTTFPNQRAAEAVSPQCHANDLVCLHIANAHFVFLEKCAVWSARPLPLLLPVFEQVKPILENEWRRLDQRRIQFASVGQRARPWLRSS